MSDVSRFFKTSDQISEKNIILAFKSARDKAKRSLALQIPPKMTFLLGLFIREKTRLNLKLRLI